MILDHIYVHI